LKVHCKVDNAFLCTKVNLRRNVIKKHFNKSSFNILNCCAAKNKVWRSLDEFYNTSIIHLDLNPQFDGVIKCDANDYVQNNDLSKFDIIDIDTYGSPWDIFFNSIKSCTGTTVFFLTWGRTEKNLFNVPNIIKQTFNFPKSSKKGRNPLCKYMEKNITSLLVRGYENGIFIKDVYEGFPQGNARYFGLTVIKED